MKQPRTKCKVNQHQKRGVPALLCVAFDEEEGSITYQYTKVPRNAVDESMENIAEMLGHRAGASYEWRPEK